MTRPLGPRYNEEQEPVAWNIPTGRNVETSGRGRSSSSLGHKRPDPTQGTDTPKAEERGSFP